MPLRIGDNSSGQRVGGHGHRCIFGMPAQKRLGLRLALMRFERAGGKYQSAAGLHPIRRTVQHRALNRGQIIDRFHVDTLQHIGVAPHRARGAAGRIQ